MLFVKVFVISLFITDSLTEGNQKAFFVFKFIIKVISTEEGLAASQSFDRLGQRVSTFGTKVLVTTGGNPFTSRDSLTTEIIDVKDSSFECNKVGKFPKPLYWANGGWVDNTPMICSGTAPWTGQTYQRSCYTLQENGTWKEEEVAKLRRRKENRISGSVVIKDQLLIPVYVGTLFKKKGDLMFEMAVPNKPTNTLKWLYVDMSRFLHNELSCIVKWDADTIMLIGVNEGGKGTFFINYGKKTVTPGPELMKGRKFHACHEMSMNGESYVVVTGGGESTEILPKSSFGNGWQRGKKLKNIS